MDQRPNNNEKSGTAFAETDPDLVPGSGIESPDVGKVTEQALGRAIERGVQKSQSSSGTNLTTDNVPADLPLSSVLVDHTNDPFKPKPAPTQSTTFKLTAKEAELIEKQWVIKAKAIVEHTKDDPYQQDKEVSKIKADYLKKRYNKDLRVDA